MLKKAQEVAARNNRSVARTEVILAEGVDFKPYYDAEHRLKKHGYVLQSMVGNRPIEFHRKNVLKGVLMTDSTYKDGGVAIVYFK